MLVETALSMAGYSGDDVPAMQKRMIDALETIPGVKSVGSVDRPPLHYGANTSTVFTDKTADLRPANAAAVQRRTAYLPNTSKRPARRCWRAEVSPGMTTKNRHA